MTSASLQVIPNPAEPSDSASDASWLMRAGWWIIGAAVLPLCLWISFAPLSMAVVAPAFVRVDLNRRPVQHLEGGIVRAVLVRDGQRVKAGDAILLLGDVGVDADRHRLDYRVIGERASLARSEAEQALATTLVFPHELLTGAQHDARIMQILAKEQALFKARHGALASELNLLGLQRLRVDDEINALRAQITLAETSYSLQSQDLNSNRSLLKEGFISPARITQIEAVVVDYASKLEERRSELSRAQQRRGELDLKMASIQNDYRKAASDQLKVTSARLTEIEQEQRKTGDAALRQMVVAPASGEVIDLKFTSPGTVIRAGELIADIVPADASLVIEARIKPEEVSNVHLDQKARIKLTAFKYRNLSMAEGKVTYVSGDRLVDRATNTPYYSVMILVDAATAPTAEDYRMQAGMPAEVYIEGTSQTPLQYLVEPLTSVIRRAGREL